MMEEPINSLEIEELMKYFNLDRTAIQIYIFVLRSKDTSVSSISTMLNCDRTKAYRTIDQLSSLGLIEELGTVPRKCYAVKPEKGFKQLIENEKYKFNVIQSEVETIIPKLNLLYNEQEERNKQVYTIVGGIIFHYARIINIIKESEKKIDLIIPFEELKKQFYTSLPEEIQKKKFVVRIISNPVTVEQKRFVTQLKNCKIKCVNERLNRMIVSEKMCFSEIFKELHRYNNTSNADTTGFVTNSDIIIKILQAKFNELWRKNGA